MIHQPLATIFYRSILFHATRSGVFSCETNVRVSAQTKPDDMDTRQGSEMLYQFNNTYSTMCMEPMGGCLNTKVTFAELLI